MIFFQSNFSTQLHKYLLYSHNVTFNRKQIYVFIRFTLSVVSLLRLAANMQTLFSCINKHSDYGLRFIVNFKSDPITPKSNEVKNRALD